MDKKESSVEILQSAINPSDPSVAVLTVAVDLSRPAQIAKDLRKALRDIPAIPLPSRAVDPKLYEALTLVREKGMTFREATSRVFGNPGKASALCRLRASITNAAVTNAQR